MRLAMRFEHMCAFCIPVKRMVCYWKLTYYKDEKFCRWTYNCMHTFIIHIHTNTPTHIHTHTHTHTHTISGHKPLKQIIQPFISNIFSYAIVESIQNTPGNHTKTDTHSLTQMQIPILPSHTLHRRTSEQNSTESPEQNNLQCLFPYM